MEASDFLPDDWREWRRLRALLLKQQGWHQRDIGNSLGVSEGTISRWLARARDGGPEALLARSSPGRPPKLSSAQKRSIPELLRYGLEALPGYAPDLNPGDEGGWHHLKNVELRNRVCRELEELHEEFHLAVGRLRYKPHLVRSFFAQAGLRVEKT